jgi:hypothetical protein
VKVHWKGCGINLQWRISKLYRRIYRKILTGEAIRRGLKRKPEVKRSFGRPGRRWKNNIKMELDKGEWEGVGCGHLP